MKKLSSLIQFVKERFDPLSHFIMIALFVGGHIAYIKAVFTSSSSPSLVKFLGGFLITSFFFLKLRCYDEIKDYDTDVAINPSRPLPRGLITHKDLFFMIFTLIVLEVTLFTCFSGRYSFYFIFSVLYSLFMYKEFFIPKLIRPHLTTYAISHTVVTVFLSLSIFSFFIGETYPTMTILEKALPFSLASWALFNLFEFGRKTFATTEERTGVSTYSNIWSRKGAVFLSFSQACLSSILLINAMSEVIPVLIKYLLIFYPVLLLFIGGYYLKKNDAKSAKLFRAMSSVYIVLVFLTLNSIIFLTL